MDLSLLLSFIAASDLLTLMPGPDILFVLTESITKGARYGIAVATGLVSGLIIHTAAAATGLSLLLKNSPQLFSVVCYLGASYLLYLAYLAYNEAQPVMEEGRGPNSSFRFAKYFKTGFFMNVMNPKVALFFLAFLPQFVPHSESSPALQIFLLGFLFMLQAYLIFTGVALLAGKATLLLRAPRFWSMLKWAKIAVLLLLAFLVAFR